jgi:hypothetical protein
MTMGTGSTLRPIEEQVLPLTEWPVRYLLLLQEILDRRAPELGVRLLVPMTGGNGSFALALGSCPPWLKGALARAFPVGYVLRVCELCDLVAADTAYRLVGWEAMATLLEPAHVPQRDDLIEWLVERTRARVKARDT